MQDTGFAPDTDARPLLGPMRETALVTFISAYAHDYSPRRGYLHVK